uniref:Fanconi-associated nuclease n=1 Tax=Chromera velia CCMP2878 TaxID=1169474 RepID=A0A0G4FDX5_9ALVE|eukprot:Cvel_16412.t1-p1 / transcript=Cvel_16412.t1 / gene=Cvel_16412 / organism=Chromera_velia_CCMP2878 / gene_product=Fanconi-associated nuclease 1, putative / transcript_product=Fanconi-associated nuclease 1, putative / location=Cvel_scaffold1263:31783-35619(+) / protein_length=1071 / sequence_SO=supercontig / SO=protein_coding / is_pseudo=false
MTANVEPDPIYIGESDSEEEEAGPLSPIRKLTSAPISSVETPYYLRCFLAVLSDTLLHQRHLFSESELSIVRTFLSVSLQGQCLLVRLLNRHGPWFRVQKLHSYSRDVPNASNTVGELHRCSLLIAYEDAQTQGQGEEATAELHKFIDVDGDGDGEGEGGAGSPLNFSDSPRQNDSEASPCSASGEAADGGGTEGRKWHCLVKSRPALSALHVLSVSELRVTSTLIPDLAVGAQRGGTRTRDSLLEHILRAQQSSAWQPLSDVDWEGAVKRRVMSLAGPLVALRPAVRELFELVKSLYGTLHGDESGVTPLLATVGKVRFPSFQIRATCRVFGDRGEVEAFLAARERERRMDAALMESTKDEETAMRLGDEAEAVVRAFVEAKRERTLSSSKTQKLHHAFLRRFLPEWIEARTAWHSVALLERRRRHGEAVERLRLLLSSSLSFDKRGKFYSRLTINLFRNLEKPREALQRGIEALQEGSMLRVSERREMMRRLRRIAVRVATEEKQGGGKKTFWLSLLPQELRDEVRAESEGAAQKAGAFREKSIFARRLGGTGGDSGQHSLFIGYNDACIRVERLVLQWHRKEGNWRGRHGEGAVLRELFGVLLFEILFGEGGPPDVFLTPYQQAPLDLATEAFYSCRRDRVEARLQEIRTSSPLALRVLTSTAARRLFGLKIRGVSWRLKFEGLDPTGADGVSAAIADAIEDADLVKGFRLRGNSGGRGAHGLGGRRERSKSMPSDKHTENEGQARGGLQQLTLPAFFARKRIKRPEAEDVMISISSDESEREEREKSGDRKEKEEKSEDARETIDERTQNGKRRATVPLQTESSHTAALSPSPPPSLDAHTSAAASASSSVSTAQTATAESGNPPLSHIPPSPPSDLKTTQSGGPGNIPESVEGIPPFFRTDEATRVLYGWMLGFWASCITGPVLAACLGMMARDYAHYSAGLPDLFLWRRKLSVEEEEEREEGDTEGGDSSFLAFLKREGVDLSSVDTEDHALAALPLGEGLFVEVKGPGDRLSEKQKEWLQEISRAGGRGEVCWVVESPPDSGTHSGSGSTQPVVPATVSRASNS